MTNRKHGTSREKGVSTINVDMETGYLGMEKQSIFVLVSARETMSIIGVLVCT